MKKSLVVVPILLALAGAAVWIGRSQAQSEGATTISHPGSTLTEADVDKAIETAIPALRAGEQEDRFALFYEDVARRRFGGLAVGHVRA